MESSHFEKQLEQMISSERVKEPNPFTGTRIMQRLDSEFLNPNNSVMPAWTKLLQPVALSMALAAGILIGSYAARTEQNNNGQSLSRQENIQNLRSELFISEITDEDDILNLNK